MSERDEFIEAFGYSPEEYFADEVELQADAERAMELALYEQLSPVAKDDDLPF